MAQTIDATGRTPREKKLEEISYYFSWAGWSKRIKDAELEAFEKECETTPVRALLEKYKKSLGGIGHDIDRTKAGVLYVKEGRKRGDSYDPVEIEELIMNVLDTPPLKLMRKYQRSFQSIAGKLRAEAKPDWERPSKPEEKTEVPKSISSAGLDLTKAYEHWYLKKGKKLLMKAFLEDYAKTL